MAPWGPLWVLPNTAKLPRTHVLLISLDSRSRHGVSASQAYIAKEKGSNTGMQTLCGGVSVLTLPRVVRLTNIGNCSYNGRGPCELNAMNVAEEAQS